MRAFVHRSSWPVVLVSMPFMDVDYPSIQLGLLKAIAEAHGFPVRTLHANLDLAARVGIDYYRKISQYRGPLIGEWLFSLEAFGDAAPDADSSLLDAFANELSYLGESPDELRKLLLRTRQQDIPAYLDSLMDTFAWEKARVVGFSSTFQQNTASFALARRLRNRYPDIRLIFGGANFDGDMGIELVRSVQVVDAAVIGEGDIAFPSLLCALVAGDDPGTVPGVVSRSGGQITVNPPLPPIPRLDDLPTPDYDEYFEHGEELGLLPPVARRKVWIPFETARGCWWGEKHHCTFCGLNGTTMQYRSKQPKRVLDELAQQARRYRSFRFAAVDNILDLGYLRTLFPMLIESGPDYEIFYEVKANLNRSQLKLLAKAGVTSIQPGLESLSSRVLGLMRKGVSAAQNINLLRWAQYYDIDVAWNILWGFPGESEKDYTDQAAVIPYLLHLQPPSSAERIWMERFSPLYTQHNNFRIRSRMPERSYQYVYPGSFDLDRVAYFFDYEADNGLPESAYTDLRRSVQEWSNSWQAGQRPVLKYWSAPHFMQIYDGRRPGHEGTYTLEGTVADIYLACSDRPITATAVQKNLDRRLPVEAVQAILSALQRRGLVFIDGSRALALAVPAVAHR
jgi:ribosomal peptide maturation radical SAM protein 1